MSPLQEGDAAPDFTLPSQEGDVSLSALRGKTIVVFFYPKDDTPGCTKEAIGFTQMLAAFEKADAVVLGVSKDTLAKHQKFAAKHDLKVTLLSDEQTTTCEDYGVWVEKNMYGKKYMGIERATFVIDAQGAVAKIWRKVKVPGHVEAVLSVVQDL